MMLKRQAAHQVLLSKGQEVTEISSKRTGSTNGQEKDQVLPCFQFLPELAGWRVALLLGEIKVCSVKELVDIIVSFPARCLSIVVEFDREDLDLNSDDICYLVAKALQKRPFLCFDITLSWTGRLDNKGLTRRLAQRLLMFPQVIALALRPKRETLENIASVVDGLPDSANQAHIFQLGLTGLDNAASQKQAADLIVKILQDENLQFLEAGETGLKLPHELLLEVSFYRSFQTSKLSYLRMRDVGLTESAGVSIAAVLAGHRTLQLLDLSYNRLGDRAIVAIAESLVSNTALRFLGLTSVGITRKGGCALASSLRENKPLEMCYLKDDDLGAETGRAFASMLTINVTLKYLVMSYSSLEPEGCKAFISALKHNRTLKHLRLNYSGIAAVDKSALVMVAKEGETLEVLELEDKNEVGQTLSSYWPYHMYSFHGNYRKHLLAYINK